MNTKTRLKKFTLFIELMSCAVTLSAENRKKAIRYARHAFGLQEKDNITVLGINL